MKRENIYIFTEQTAHTNTEKNLPRQPTLLEEDRHFQKDMELMRTDTAVAALF